MFYTVKVNGRQYDVEIEKRQQYAQQAPIYQQPVSYQQQPPIQQAPPPSSAGKDIEVLSPISGSIFNILVNVGDRVNAGDPLIVIEAMKMENEIAADNAGTVKQILVSKGSTVDVNDVLVVLN